MIRDPVVVRSPQATAVKCHDAREGFSALRGGGVSLTEWALAEAHRRQCAECRQEEARLQQVAAARRVTPPRALMDSFGNAMEVTRIGVTRPAALFVPLRAFPTAALTLTARASAAMIQAVDRGIGQSLDLIARLHAVLAAALALAARPVGGVIKAIGRGVGHSADLIARLRAVLAAALTLTPRASAAVIQAIGRGIGQSLDLIARLRAVLAAALALAARPVGGVIKAIGRGVGHSADLIARLRAVLAAALTLTPRASAAVIQAIGRGVGHSADLIARLAAALTLTPRASAAVIQAIGRGITRSVAWIARLAIPLKTSVRAAGVVLVLAFVLYTLPWTPGPRQHVRSTAAPGPRLEPTQIVSFLPLPPVAPSVEPNGTAPAAPRIDGPRQSPSKASAIPSQRLPVREAARETPALPAPVPERMAPVTHVVGRLTAKDRTAAERDFTALLAGVGGSELGRQHRGAFTAVEVVVPQSRYNDFARGLTRLGSWQLEAARSPLPDAVHMTIRVSEQVKAPPASRAPEDAERGPVVPVPPLRRLPAAAHGHDQEHQERIGR